MSKVDTFIRTNDEQKRCDEIHDTFREELLKRQLSNSENYDKAILSLSSSALALSLTAIKFVVPLSSADYLWAIKTSWVLFLVTIILSLSSFLISNLAISRQLSIAEDYYLKALVKAQTENNRYTTINSLSNRMTGVVFVLAISMVIFFVTANIHGAANMSIKKNSNPDKVTTNILKKSAGIPEMQVAPGSTKKVALSADIPTMQMAPGGKAAPKSTKPAEDNSSKAKSNSGK